ASRRGVGGRRPHHWTRTGAARCGPFGSTGKNRPGRSWSGRGHRNRSTLLSPPHFVTIFRSQLFGFSGIGRGRPRDFSGFWTAMLRRSPLRFGLPGKRWRQSHGRHAGHGDVEPAGLRRERADLAVEPTHQGPALGPAAQRVELGEDRGGAVRHGGEGCWVAG